MSRNLDAALSVLDRALGNDHDASPNLPTVSPLHRIRYWCPDCEVMLVADAQASRPACWDCGGPTDVYDWRVNATHAPGRNWL